MIVFNDMKALFCLVLVAAFYFVPGCAEKEFDPNDAEKSYKIAKEPYDDKNYDVAVTKLGEFKSRFPYSRFAVEAELLLANSQFNLGRYIDAGGSYKQFVTLHPKHPEVPFSMYRVGECYWMDAPEDADREQDFTNKAVVEWKKLIKEFPDNEYSKKAREFVELGERRIALSEETVSAFYCKKEIWHACAFRNREIATKFSQFPDISQRAFLNASNALYKLADQYDSLKKDHDLFIKNYSKEDLLKEAARLKSIGESSLQAVH